MLENLQNFIHIDMELSSVNQVVSEVKDGRWTDRPRSRLEEIIGKAVSIPFEAYH